MASITSVLILCAFVSSVSVDISTQHTYDVSEEIDLFMVTSHTNLLTYTCTCVSKRQERAMELSPT